MIDIDLPSGYSSGRDGRFPWKSIPVRRQSMKVSELIERLREFDPELEVRVQSPTITGDDVEFDIIDIEDEGDTLFVEVE